MRILVSKIGGVSKNALGIPRAFFRLLFYELEPDSPNSFYIVVVRIGLCDLAP